MTLNDEIFPDVFAVFNHLKELGWLGIPFHTPPCFEVMELYDNRMAAAPMPMSPLYRGESEFHKCCVPSLYRRKWSELASLKRQVQLEDFRLILQTNPEIREMEDAGLMVNYNGLAQHYGIETNILDVTNSFLVAAFFATTTYDALQDVYKPILHTVSSGVIYFFPSGSFLNFGQYAPIWPIGLEALRRPGEQRGFGVEMDNVRNDLNHYPGVHTFRFWHSPQASLEIWRRTKGGMDLFPFDPMAEKVRNMRKYRIYSEEGFSVACNKMGISMLDVTNVRNHLIQDGCTFVEKLPFAYTDKESDYIYNLFKQKYPGN